MTPQNTPSWLHTQFLEQKHAYQANPFATKNQRLERLLRLKQALLTHKDALVQAISQDYGNRSLMESKIGELLTCLEHIKYYSKHLGAWMKPSKRTIGFLHQPAKGWVQYQPLGVIGIITPWNYPLMLSVGPLICALAAGNHAMIKLSSNNTYFGQALKTALEEVFDPNLVCVITGDRAISDAFSRLPFDKIVFTGSTQVGKTIMKIASDNLVPILLELGGKSPAIVHSSMDMAEAASRICFGKLWNAGQTCVAPDYVYLPKGRVEDFCQAFIKTAATMYPTLANNPDYTSIINDRQYQRLQNYLNDAKYKGATIITHHPNQENLEPTRKIAPTLVYKVCDNMLIMQEEIFGPILPIIEYEDLDQVVDELNQKDRPLALYYFDFDDERADWLAKRTHSGHFGQNTVLTHPAQDDLPFGGVGASGMGKYHGKEGFYAFCHARSVMSSPRLYSLKYIFPPFDKPLHRWIEKMFIK